MGLITRGVSALKNAVTPSGVKFRKIRFGPASGCVLKLDLQNRMRLYLGFYEAEISRYFRDMIRPGSKCFDVGGDCGYDALMMSKLSGGETVSFECSDAAAESMQENFAQNPYSIQILRAAVGDHNTDGFVTLDAAAQKYFTPDFIKIDIDGGETAALAGAKEILGSRKPHLIVETHSPELENQCLESLRASGYSPLIVDQRKWLPDFRPIDHNRWLIAYGRNR